MAEQCHNRPSWLYVSQISATQIWRDSDAEPQPGAKQLRTLTMATNWSVCRSHGLSRKIGRGSIYTYSPPPSLFDHFSWYLCLDDCICFFRWLPVMKALVSSKQGMANTHRDGLWFQLNGRWRSFSAPQQWTWDNRIRESLLEHFLTMLYGYHTPTREHSSPI